MIYLVAAALLSFAQAQTVNRDWTFIETADPILQTQVCRAFTGVSNSAVPIEISLNFPKARDKAPAIFLKMAGVDKAALSLSSREAEDLIALQPGVLYHVPTQFKKLVDVIERANFLPFTYSQNGSTVSVRISLAGSERTLRAVATCLGVRETVPVDFFSDLNARITDLGGAGANETAAQLLDYVQQAYVSHGERAKASAALETLRTQMRPLVRRETEALGALAAAQAPLDRALAARSATERAIAEGEARLAAIPGELQTLHTQKTEAERIEAKKLAVFEPLRTRAEELDRDVRRARGEVNSYSSAITERRNLISSNESEISSLESEANTLASRLRSIDNDLSPLQRRRAGLQSDLNAYNVDFEKRKILSNDFRYQQLRNSLGDLNRNRQMWRGEVNRFEDESRRADQDLSNCRSVAGRDCTAEQNRADNARNQLANARSQLQNVEWQCQQTENQIRDIENEAERRAINGREEIASQLRGVESQIADLESERDRSERRKRDIESSLIPNLESENSRERAEIPGLERSLNRAQRDLADARAALDAYKRSVNYDQVEAEYEAARDAVQTLKEGITERETEQRRLNRKLPELRNTLTANQREVDRRTVARDREQVKVTDIQNQLKPQRDQESILAANLATWDGQFVELRKLYQGLVSRLAP